MKFDFEFKFWIYKEKKKTAVDYNTGKHRIEHNINKQWTDKGYQTNTVWWGTNLI